MMGRGIVALSILLRMSKRNSMEQHRPHPHKPQNVNALHRSEQRGLNQRLAVLITRSFGTMTAFYVLVLWMLVWIGLASAGVWLFARDSYPFAFLLFLSNLVQLWALRSEERRVGKECRSR